MGEFPLTKTDPVGPLQDDIDRTRRELTLTANALKRKLAARAWPSEWVRQRPYAILIGAFVFGFYLGGRK